MLQSGHNSVLSLKIQKEKGKNIPVAPEVNKYNGIYDGEKQYSHMAGFTKSGKRSLMNCFFVLFCCEDSE